MKMINCQFHILMLSTKRSAVEKNYINFDVIGYNEVVYTHCKRGEKMPIFLKCCTMADSSNEMETSDLNFVFVFVLGLDCQDFRKQLSIIILELCLGGGPKESRATVDHVASDL